jgi:bifunctional DNA-binding transcriptional regulator/antitoxin component of YhaV-PrlF toxin-antitoxin module
LSHLVGSKGQIVIAKELRDRLGVEPGWIALQHLAGDHIEVYFVPPQHNKSLKGQLAKHIKTRIPSGNEWKEAREKAWAIASKEEIEGENKYHG